MSSRHDAGALIRSMLVLRDEKRSGVLEVEAEGVRTSIYLLDGVPVFAAEATAGETLGRLLVRQGVMTQEECNVVLARMTAVPAGKEPQRFGAAAIDLGLLTEAQLQHALAQQAKWKMVFLFQRENPEWPTRIFRRSCHRHRCCRSQRGQG